MTSDIPTSFGFPTFVKVVLPGIIFSILCTYFVLPLIPLPFAIAITLMIFTDKIIFWVASGIIFGLVISSLDRYIYQLFMGNGVLPEYVLNAMYSRLLKDFGGLEEDFESTNSELALIFPPSNDEEIKQNIKQFRSLRHKNADVCYKLREYPFNNELRQVYPRTPTRLGNVITEYESYSEEQYGMNFHVFWSRIWQILPKSGKR